jgi:NADPH-dependent F420 reductase
MTQIVQSIAVIGGTGQLGAVIARRLVKAGKSIIIGSRDPVKAEAAARQLGAELGCEVAFGGNVAAADAAEVVILTVPFASQRTTLEDIRSSVAGKIVIDTTVPLMPPKVMRVQLPPEGSAAQRAQEILGEPVRVVSAFHNVAAHKLMTDAFVECDVLVFGDDKSAREVAVSIVEACGLRGLHGGVLANSAAAEAMTSVLIFLNKHYSVDGAGVRITGQLMVPVAR